MRWEGDVKRELKTLKIFHWKKQAKYRNGWKRIIEGGPKFTRSWSVEEEQVEEE